MTEEVTKIKIFVASPGDVNNERKRVKKVIEELNKTVCPSRSLTLEYKGWEEVVPDIGKPGQRAIDEQIGPYDIFIGIMWKKFGHPTLGAGSGTEHEFNMAYKKRKKFGEPRILFYFSQKPSTPKTEKETEQWGKVIKFKKKVQKLGLTKDYKNPSDFEKIVREHLTKIVADWGKEPTIVEKKKPATLVTFIPHPYPEAPNFTGRVTEKKMLTDWLMHDPGHPLLSMVAIGGMGKSALAWRWLQEEVLKHGNGEDGIGNGEKIELEGVVWWSFYEKGMTFDCFIRDFAANLWGDDSPKLKRSMSELYNDVYLEFQQNNYLIILDGVERILRAYTGLGSPYQGDDVKEDPNQDFRGCIDPNADSFFQHLSTSINKSKTLLTTRLHPKALDTVDGCLRKDLESMDKEDAVEFFHAQGVKGTRVEIQLACDPYGYHPLKLRLLSGLILEDKENPGDCSQSKYCKIGDVAPKKHYIMEISYNALDKKKQNFISSLAAFRASMEYPAIKGISKFKSKKDLDVVLTELVNRGLLFWDKEKNRYDLHPIVRSYCYDRLRDKEDVHSQLRDYFASVPEPEKIESLDDLAPVIELYHHTVGAGRYDEAYNLMRERLLPDQLHFQFGAYSLSIEIMGAFFKDIEYRKAKIKDEGIIAVLYNGLAVSYSLAGQPRRAVPLFEKQIAISEKREVAIGLGNLADDQLNIGDLESAEANLRGKIKIVYEIKDEPHKARSHHELGRVLSFLGEFIKSECELNSAMDIFKSIEHIQMIGLVWAYRSLPALLMDDPTEALKCANKALEFAKKDEETDSRTPRDFIQDHYFLGASHVALKDIAKAEENLQFAITECRKINMVDHEALILLELAKLRHLQKRDEESIKLTNEGLEIANRCSYVLQQADIHLFLAQYHKDLGDLAKAREHAELAKLRSHQMIDVETGDYITKPENTKYKYKPCYDKAVQLLEGLTS